MKGYPGSLRRLIMCWRDCLPGRSLLCLIFILPFTLTACTGIFGGQSWVASGLEQQQIQVVTIDPTHLRTFYAGDTRDGVFVSSDAGAHWKQSGTGLPLPLTIKALSFDIPGKKLFVATSAGLFMSNDAATHWSKVTGVPTDIYTALAFDVNSPQVVYAATTHSGILKSSDDGTSWTTISKGLPAGALTSILYDPNLKQLWAAFPDRIYRSDNQGASWQNMSNGLPTDAGINILAAGSVTSSTSNLVFAGTDHGFYRTSDGGQHWAPSQFSLVHLRIQAILLDATQANVVYISTSIGVLSSKDNGQNWSQVAAGLPLHQPIAGLAQGDDGYTQLIAGSSHGIYLYPGTTNGLSPSRFISIVLVLLFFFLLYYFFSVRRRRSAMRYAASLGEPPEQMTSQTGPPPKERL